MIHPILRLLYAPDNDTTGGASSMTFEVPETPSAAAESTIEPVEFAPSIAESVPGVMGPKEALGDDGTDEMEKMEAKMEGREPRERDASGKFLPKGQKKPETKPQAKMEPKVAKPPPKPPAKAPAKQAPKAVEHPAPPQKFKIGDEEKTVEEWQKEIADVRAKAAAIEAKKAPIEEPPKAPEKPALKPEEIEAEQKKQVEDFIARESKKYEIPPKELDEILAGLDGAPAALAKVLTRVEANTRQWAAKEFNKILAGMQKNITPLMEHQQRLAEYQRDNGFLESNPEIKAHPKGYETYLEVRKDMQEGHRRIKAEIAAGKASPRETAWAALYDTLTPEEIQSNIATHTKAKLAALAPVDEPPPKTELQKTPQKSPAATKPFNGDRPGGGGAHLAVESADARALREMTEAGR